MDYDFDNVSSFSWLVIMKLVISETICLTADMITKLSHHISKCKIKIHPSFLVTVLSMLTIDISVTGCASAKKFIVSIGLTAGLQVFGGDYWTKKSSYLLS